MPPVTTPPLDDQKRTRCLDCGATIWLYSGANGYRVALENAPGRYVIHDADAYESSPGSGYRNHWDHCRSRTQPPGQVSEDEFLWN